MNAQKEVAARSPKRAARKNILHNKSYREAAPLSRLKLAIGEMLLFGNQERREFWELFEALLSQLYQERSQNACDGRDMAGGSTVGQGVSG